MQILSKNIFEFKLSPTRVMALKEIFLIVKSWETRQAMALVKNNGWDYSASIEKETQFQCKTVRFQLLKRKINYLYKRKPCAVLSHSKQAIIWFVQWCVYQINNKALNCPVSNFQEKGKYNAFCLLVLFYTVDKEHGHNNAASLYRLSLALNPRCSDFDKWQQKYHIDLHGNANIMFMVQCMY